MNPRRLENLREVTMMFNKFLVPNISEIHLDFGCGIGDSTFFQATSAPNSKIIGYDLDEDKILLAKERLKMSSLENLNFYNSKEDILKPNSASICFVYHEAPQSINEVYDILLPNSKLCILDYNMKNISKRNFKKMFCADNERKTLFNEGLENCFTKHTNLDVHDCIYEAKHSGFIINTAYSSDKYFAIVCEKVS